MTTTTPKPPDSPCTSSELLDWLVANAGEQAMVYKSLWNGIARSGYSIMHCGNDEFDMFVDIEDRWVTMKRKKFLKFHGDVERIWYFY